MRKAEFNSKIAALINLGRPLSVSDFMEAFPGAPTATVYSRIRALQKTGLISQTGRGQYVAVHKPKYIVPVTEWMLQVNAVLLDSCEGINHCIYEKARNLIVEVPRGDVNQVLERLKINFPGEVISQKDANRFPAPLEGYIIVGTLVSDAPIAVDGGMCVPSLEKKLIDELCRPKNDQEAIRHEFQKALDVYPVNVNRMQRYAARRGVREELSSCLSSVDSGRSEMFSKIQQYLTHAPVARAWVFGSYARGEETETSDLDLLVDYLPESQVSLLDIIRQRLDLEKIVGRTVDLVENGNLRPFAAASAERDKYLIYER